ncbi:ATPase, T2SS/T4P/T4SS family [Lysinibacillus sp. NPDC093712]|uniref:ATPase, T2SS/T4P/T4SS family n=1 Tax=Lysinibacillus sp. NPDC093712 TaxID=3390579 RepID=UPI003D02ACA6
MSHLTNGIIMVSIIVGTLTLLFIFIMKKNAKVAGYDNKNDRALYHYGAIQSFIKKRMNELTTSNLLAENLSEEEYKRRTRRRQELKDALKNCNTGDLQSKLYVREYIYDLLASEYGYTAESINWTIPFDNPRQMSSREKFETLLYVFSSKYGNKALGWMIDTYELAKPKEDGGYHISTEEIEMIYKKHIKSGKLKFEDKLHVISQIIYSQYKGFGIIDEIRDMSIDGVSGGVSGLPKRMTTAYESDRELLSESTKRLSGMESAWIMYKGKSIHLRFLSFEHESEIRRVVTNVYKYGYPGQLSESRPAIINEMHDGSRVTVMRPKLSESWAFFIRKKYDAIVLTLHDLITQPNKDLPIKTLEFLMKGNRTSAITGAQGSGKTTLLMAMVGHIHAALNLRIQETSFELNMRSLLPNRNILSFEETDSMSGQDGLDLQKKTDGHVTILGEVATDPVAAWMIQSAQVASLFTIFTHHAKTFPLLVEALRNSLLKVGIFNNEKIAEQQVVNVLEFDIHLSQGHDGYRFIERITECIPIEYDDESTIKEKLKVATTKDDKLEAFLEVGITFFQQQTQQKQYVERTILEFRDGDYVAVQPISKKRQKEIELLLSPEDRIAFKEFIHMYWGNVA